MRYTPLSLFSLVLVSGLAIHSSSATASTCERWENDLDACDVLSVDICSNPSVWEPQNWITFQNWKYSDTGLQACDKYFQKEDPGIYNGIVAVFPTSNPDNFDCYMDGNGDGVANPNDSSFYTQVHIATVTRDECCDLTPEGPYSNLPGLWPTSRGGDFAQSLKDGILANNNATNNLPISYEYHSDATTVPPMSTAVDYWTTLVARGALLDRYPQVDHIIPRKDSKGCTCGSNSKANALVISGKLNREMSNNCLDPKRLQILDAYTH